MSIELKTLPINNNGDSLKAYQYKGLIYSEQPISTVYQLRCNNYDTSDLFAWDIEKLISSDFRLNHIYLVSNDANDLTNFIATIDILDGNDLIYSFDVTNTTADISGKTVVFCFPDIVIPVSSEIQFTSNIGFKSLILQGQLAMIFPFNGNNSGDNPNTYT